MHASPWRVMRILGSLGYQIPVTPAGLRYVLSMQFGVVQIILNGFENSILSELKFYQEIILGPEIILVRGLVQLVPAVAYYFCLN